MQITFVFSDPNSTGFQLRDGLLGPAAFWQRWRSTGRTRYSPYRRGLAPCSGRSWARNSVFGPTSCLPQHLPSKKKRNPRRIVVSCPAHLAASFFVTRYTRFFFLFFFFFLLLHVSSSSLSLLPLLILASPRLLLPLPSPSSVLRRCHARSARHA